MGLIDPTEKKAREQWTAPKHEHWAGSVYVRCRDCLTFGIPMPGEYQCGNCNSHNMVSYNPPCCIAAALEAERNAGREEGKKWVKLEWEKEGYRRGLEEAAKIIRDEAQKWSGDAELYTLPDNKLARQMKAAMEAVVLKIQDLKV